ncbi:response regulator [Neosynechococcus sphagnicola]|uniref:ATP-binding response regulator n=1 Tax=Neosynechococcus sphagnicola TaxID=1501145 RepID=UPI000A71DFB3|nr:response regulator [Neosynechococcus sphagnicola]
MRLAFPTDIIEEMFLLKADQVLVTTGQPILERDGYLLPLIYLGQWLKFHCPRQSMDPESAPVINLPTVLTIAQGNQLVGFQVDRCWGEQEVAIRQVEGTIPMSPGFIGCTILGDGQIVPLVDAGKLLDWIHDQGGDGTSKGGATPMGTLSPSSIPQLNADNSATDGQQRPIATNRILIVDDSVNVRRFLALTLEKAGYQVEQAKDGQDAVEKLLGGDLQVQAVICDIEMPRLDGYGFLARIKADPAHRWLPIAMLTSRSGDKHRQLAMSLGAAAYFTKPYKEAELLQSLQNLISASQSHAL